MLPAVFRLMATSRRIASSHDRFLLLGCSPEFMLSDGIVPMEVFCIRSPVSAIEEKGPGPQDAAV